MAKTILGYEVASPERQRKTALAIFGFIGVMALAGLIVLFMVSHWEQSGRQQAIAKIISADTKCRYVVRNIGKRVSYHDHTGYTACSRAHAVARANDNPLGSVQRRTIAQIDFKIEDGSRVRTSVTLHGDGDFRAGRNVEILYRAEDSKDVVEFNEIPLFGKDSINQGSQPLRTSPPASTNESKVASETKPPARAPEEVERPGPRASENVSDNTKLWVGIAALVLMGLGVFWIVRLLYRLAKRVVFGSVQRQAEGPSASHSTSIPRMNALGSQTVRCTFGQG